MRLSAYKSLNGSDFIVLKLSRLISKLVFWIIIVVAIIWGLIFCSKVVMKCIYPLKYTDFVEEASCNCGVEKELVYAIIKCESGFDENAESHAGACGLMQITPETFEWLKTHAKKIPVKIDEDIHDPRTNIMLGTLFVSMLMNKYENEKLVLCAYNAGMSVVDRWLRSSGNFQDTHDIENIPYPETKNYVKKVERAKKIYKELYF